MGLSPPSDLTLLRLPARFLLEFALSLLQHLGSHSYHHWLDLPQIAHFLHDSLQSLLPMGPSLPPDLTLLKLVTRFLLVFTLCLLRRLESRFRFSIKAISQLQQYKRERTTYRFTPAKLSLS